MAASPASPKPDHAEEATQYARDVVDRRILACKYVRMACQRHLDDLERQDTPDFPYVYDKALAGKFIRFMECLPHVTGTKASRGELFVMMPWQKFLVALLTGWIHAPSHRRAGQRRFNRAYVEVGRGNGKSFLSSALCLAMLAIDGQTGGQVIAAGKNAIQSRIVLTEAQQMVRKTPALMKAVGVTLTAHEIRQDRTHSRMFAISADKAGSADGKMPSFASVDELHSHPNSGTYAAMDLALAKREGALLLCITTAGGDAGGSICWEIHDHLVKTLEKNVVDEASFGLIYTIDDGMDWRTEEAWRCANPNYGESIVPEAIATACQRAQDSPASANGFKTKNLCIWAGADDNWIPLEVWDRTHDPKLDIRDYRGQPCWIGLDVATKSDLCGKVYLFKDRTAAKDSYVVFTQAYLPETAFTASRTNSYRAWEAQGFLAVTDGDVTDFERLEADLINDSSLYDVQDIGFDPWNMAGSAQRLMAQGANVVEVRPNVANFSGPMKYISELVLQGRLKTNCPVLRWCIGNTVCHEDANSNIFPRKLGNTPANKIDLSVALITAMARAMIAEDKASVYETRDLMVIGW